MASPRRIGAPDAKNRGLLLDAAEQLMLDKGYAAVTSRRVAEAAGLKPQLVHYYFRTMDDLFLDVFRRRAEEGLAYQARLMDSDQPLWAFWDFSTQSAGTALTMEFVGLSNHRKTIRAEVARYAELFRTTQLEALENLMPRYEINLGDFPPSAILFFMTSLSRVLVMEQTLGMSSGHAEALAVVERELERLEGPRRRAPGGSDEVDAGPRS
ncbi:TetR/AcrR family transcriptional regulator [Nocardia callitridis]|uniref:TetR/AcrR family transcriptional regulator n=1 Tax=Nocardia callitridis TaxID=648753 RepID=A0ABP9K990_9NOCA